MLFDALKEKPALTLAFGAAFFAYHAGAKFNSAVGPSPIQVIGFATSTSTASTLNLLKLSSFASLEFPPPIVPPGDKQQQG